MSPQLSTAHSTISIWEKCIPVLNGRKIDTKIDPGIFQTTEAANVKIPNALPAVAYEIFPTLIA